MADSPRLVEIDRKTEAKARALSLALASWRRDLFALYAKDAIDRAAAKAGHKVSKEDRGAALRRRLQGLVKKHGADGIRSGWLANGGGKPISRKNALALEDWGEFEANLSASIWEQADRDLLRAAETVLKEGGRGSVRSRVLSLINQDDPTDAASLNRARNVLATAESLGQQEAYRERGVVATEWLAFRAPRFKRRHDKMHGVIVGLGERFTLPSGAKLRYPHDPSGPVGEVVNCRCSTAPVIPGTKAYERWAENQHRETKPPKGPEKKSSKMGLRFGLDHVARERGHDLANFDAGALREAVRQSRARDIDDVKLARARRMVSRAQKTGEPITVPRISIDHNGRPRIQDGAHILEALAEHAETTGAKQIPVGVAPMAKRVLAERTKEAKRVLEKRAEAAAKKLPTIRGAAIASRRYKARVVDLGSGSFVATAQDTQAVTSAGDYSGSVAIEQIERRDLKPEAKSRVGMRQAYMISEVNPVAGKPGARAYLVAVAKDEVRNRGGVLVSPSQVKEN